MATIPIQAHEAARRIAERPGHPRVDPAQLAAAAVRRDLDAEATFDGPLTVSQLAAHLRRLEEAGHGSCVVRFMDAEGGHPIFDAENAPRGPAGAVYLHG